MHSENMYWNLPMKELEELGHEQVMLLKYAWGRRRFAEAREHEKNLSLIMDAMAARKRGGLK